MGLPSIYVNGVRLLPIAKRVIALEITLEFVLLYLIFLKEISTTIYKRRFLHFRKITFFHTFPGLIMQFHILGQQGMYARYLFIDSLRNSPNGKMRVGCRAQLTKREGFTQVELSQHTAVKSIGDNILRNTRVELIQLLIYLCCRFHGLLIL